MGLSISGFRGREIDTSGQVSSDQVSTDTTTQSTDLDPSQQTETYNFDDDISEAQGDPTTTDTTTQGVDGPGQPGGSDSSGFTPTSGEGAGASGPGQSGGPGSGQAGGTGPQGGNVTGAGTEMNSPGGMSSGGNNGGSPTLDTGGMSGNGADRSGATPSAGSGNTGSQGGMGSGTGMEIRVTGTDITMYAEGDVPDGETFFHEGKAYIVTGHNVDGSLNAEDMTTDLVDQLSNVGISEIDINRVLSGEITIQDLFTEIQQDDLDSDRYRQLMENSMIQAIKNSNTDGDYSFFVFNNMDELNEFINSKEHELAELIRQRNAADNHELDGIAIIINKLNEGYSLEQALNQPVAWSFIDPDTGEKKYVYTDPYANMAYEGNYGNAVMYTPQTFEDMYPDSEYLTQIKDHCYEYTINHWFREDETAHKWDPYDSETREFYFGLLDQVYEHQENRAARLAEIDAKIEGLVSEIEYSKWAKAYVENEYAYYNNNIRKYTRNDDFIDNCSYDPNITNDVYNNLPPGNSYSYDGTTIATFNDKEDIVKFIVAMANGEIPTSNYMFQNGQVYQITSSDPLLQHYVDWLSKRDGEGNIPLSAEEIAVINYIYNTSDHPIDELYEYLNFINDTDVSLADKLDERWLYRQQEIDKAFADAHPWLASIWSVIATPFEGISAAINSYSAVSQGFKIARCDVYSSGDTMRSQVSYNIGQKYGETWQFVYDTGMSMADSVALIAVTYFTGGAGFAVTSLLSATLMGSRAYVSTLNEGLDRGLTDAQSVLLATTSALVETAMEAFSVGHLMNLEGALGAVTEGLSSRVGNLFTNEAAQAFMTNLTYCVAGSISQGIAEGEEEFCTELLNTVFDLLIAKDKSKIEQSAAYYQKLGLTDAEISDRLMMDFSSQLFQAFKGGFLSGLVFGGFGSAKTTALTSHGIANGMYDGNINLDASTADQIVEAIQYNKQQQEALENVNSRYSLKDVMKQLQSGATLREAYKSLQHGAVYNDAVIQLENGGTLTEQQMKVLEDYKLIEGGLIEQNVKSLSKEEIGRRIRAILGGYKAPSLTEVVKETQAADLAVSLYSGQFQAPENLSAITREQQAYSDAFFAMQKTAERLELTRVGALGQLRGFVEGQSNLITSRFNARSILKQYTPGELRNAYQAIYQNVINDMNVDIQNAIDGVAQVCKINPYDASRLVEAYINGQQLSDLRFPSNFDYSSLEAIKINYNKFLPSAGQFDYSFVYSGIASYNRVIELQDRMSQVVGQLQGTDRFQTKEDVLSYLTHIGRTGDFIDLASTIADSTLYHADRFEFARAIERLNNSYFEEKAITDVLFTDFENALNSGVKSDHKAASLLYQTLSISHSRGNPFAAQVIKTIMKIKQYDPNFHLTSETYSECYFSDRQSRIEIGKNHTAMLDQGTIMHELGHALWKYVSRETLPVSWNQEAQYARGRASNNSQALSALNQLEHDLENISRYCYNEAIAQFENQIIQTKGKTLAQYQQSLARSLSLKATLFKNHTLANFKETLTKLGYSTKEMNKLLDEFKNNGFDANKAAATIIQANIGKLRDEIGRTQYPDYCALSDIVSAMFYGRDQNGIQRDLNGREIYVTYTHDNEYYTNKNRNTSIQTEISVFHEVIANYTQLMMTGPNNTIYYLNHIFGQNFVDMLYGSFTSNIQLNKYVQYASNINFVKVDEAIRIIDEVNNMTARELPLRYSNVDFFHEWFIGELINKGVLDTNVDPRIMQKILENRTFSEFLLKTQTAFFDRQLEAAINSKLRHQSVFGNLTPTEFYTYFNNSTRASGILDNITPTQLGNLLTNMGTNTLSWIYNPVIRDTITNFNAQQMNEFLNNCEDLRLDIISHPRLAQSQWADIVNNFYGEIKTNFANFDFLSKNPDMAYKLRRLIPSFSSIENCRNAFDVVDSFQTMYMKIQALRPGSENISSNLNIINDVIKTTSIPLGFDSIESYKRCFLETLINSQYYAYVENNATNALISDPLFLNMLAGSEKIDRLLTRNLENDAAARMILPSLAKGTQESFDKVFNTSTMNQYIHNLNPAGLATIIKRMNDSNNWWIANETIVSKITTFNANEMSIFINALGYMDIKNSIIANSNSIAVSAFFDKLIQLSNISDIEANPQLYNSLNEIYKRIENISPVGNLYLESKINSFINNMNGIKGEIANRIASIVPTNLAGNMTIDSDSNVKLEVDENYTYHNVTVEVDGKIKTLLATANSSFIGATTINLSACLDNSEFHEALLKGTLKIVDISPNIVKEELVINAQQGDGLYQATFVVDGIEYKEIRYSKYGIIDFGSRHQTGQTAELKSVDFLGNYEINTPIDNSRLYKISFKENGIEKVYYTTSTGGIIDLNRFISDLNTNYMDFSSLSVDPVTNPQELLAGIKGLTDGIFAGDDYGGNQSNPTSYMKSFFDASGSLFEMDMGSRISDMMEDFFPELKTMSESRAKALKIRLARLYAKSGCGYMAYANAVTQYLSSIENGAQIYEQAFGIPIQIDGKYTEEFLAISFCMSGIANEVNGEISQLNARVIDDLGFQQRIIDYTTNYLSQRGIQITTERFSPSPYVRSSLLSHIASTPTSFHILLAAQFDLEKLSTTTSVGENLDSALANSTLSGDIREKVGGHAMLVTEVTPAGEIIVSSWRQKFRFIPESLSKYSNSFSSMWKVDISLSQTQATQSLAAMEDSIRTTSSEFTIGSTNSLESADISTSNPIQSTDSRISDMISQVTTMDIEDFDLEISDLLSSTDSISMTNLKALAEIYKTTRTEFTEDINLQINIRMIKNMLEEGDITGVKKIVKKLSESQRIDLISDLLLNGKILSGKEFSTIISDNSNSKIVINNLNTIQNLMQQVFNLEGLSNVDKANIIEIITEISKQISVENQDFLQELITSYCKSINYKTFTKEIDDMTLSVFNVRVFKKISSMNFIEELKEELPESRARQIEEDIEKMADLVEQSLIDEVEKSMKYDITKRETYPFIALKNMPLGIVGLLKEGFNGIKIDNHAYYMFSAYTDSSGIKKLIILQSAKGKSFGATNHWYDISQIGTGNSNYDERVDSRGRVIDSIDVVNIKNTIKQRILDAANTGLRVGTATNEDFKNAADKLFNHALSEFTKGHFVEISGEEANYPETSNRDYPGKRIYRCYVDASEVPGVHFYVEIMYATDVMLNSITATHIYHITPLSKDNYSPGELGVLYYQIRGGNVIIDENEGLIVKDGRGNKINP